jgi:AcrR family transcriptional regulator
MASVHEPGRAEAPTRSAPDTPLKERQRQEREQLILQAATELLMEKGYHETSMEEIAARVRISKGAVYLHFESKEDLIIALFERGARAVAGVVTETLSTDETPREKLSQLIRQIYGSMSARFQLMSVVMQSPELQRLLASRRDTMASMWAEPSRRIASVIDEGKARCEFDERLPTALVPTLLWGLLSPHSYEQLIVHDGMALDELVSHLCRYFLRGIAALEVPEVEGGER